jgi:DNA repair protein RadC
MQRPRVTTSKEMVNIIREVEDMKKNIDYKELFFAIYLNQDNRILSVGKVSEGTTTTCPANVRQIIQSAILQNCTGLILCHNHPSGSPDPSPQDIQSTHNIREAAKLLQIQLIDSLIITSYNYYSFLEGGLL